MECHSRIPPVEHITPRRRPLDPRRLPRTSRGRLATCLTLVAPLASCTLYSPTAAAPARCCRRRSSRRRHRGRHRLHTHPAQRASRARLASTWLRHRYNPGSSPVLMRYHATGLRLPSSPSDSDHGQITNQRRARPNQRPKSPSSLPITGACSSPSPGKRNSSNATPC